jgi:Flp pilus assembly protein TadD
VARHSLTREPRTCGVCGSKNRPDWRKCQRCRSPLAGALSDVGTEAAVSTGRVASIALIAAVVVIVAVGSLLLMRGPARQAAKPRSDGGGTRAAATVSATTDRPAGDSRPVSPEPMTAADFARRGAESFRTEDFVSAVTAFEAAVAARPDDPDALNNLGQTLVRLNRAQEAIIKFESAVQLAPQKWAYRFNLARARGLSGDWAGAVEDYRAADRLFPDDHATLFNLALALRKAGRVEEALPVLERVTTLAPGDPSFVLTAARTYDELDRRAEAVASYRKFLSQSAPGADAEAARGRLALLESSDGR